jgi:MutS domain V
VTAFLSSHATLLFVMIIGGAVIVPRIAQQLVITLRLRSDRGTSRRDRPADPRVTSAYHEQLPDAERRGALDDRTWADLDGDDLFRALDYTASEPGRQYLYHRLRSPVWEPEPLHRLDASARVLAADPQLAERIRRALSPLAGPDAGYVVQLLFADLPRRPRFWWVFPGLTGASLVFLALAPFWPVLGAYLAGLAVANVTAQAVYKPRVQRYIPAIRQIRAFLRTAECVGAMDGAVPSDAYALLRDGARHLHGLKRAASWLVFEPSQSTGAGNELGASLFEYVNLLLLLDVNAYLFSVESVGAERGRLRAMFEAIGHLDAAQSLASWRATLAHWSTPEFTPPRKAIRVEGLVHPLVAQPVANDLTVEGTGVLVSGSNMAGKTTFVRALGMSAVLAQTLFTVCADAWRAPWLEVRSSIGRADSVMEGKSYYLAEAESVRSLIHAKDDGKQHLFLLDETFRGTNTTERVAAAYAVLRYLDRGLDLVVVATHDLEVLDLLGGAYAAYHFREQVTNHELTFDYRLQHGPSSTRNAIALLRFMQYPETIVDDATASLDWQHRRGAAG